MPTLEDAARIALALPGAEETTRWGHRTWSVGGKGFAWERPLSKADVKRLAGAPLPDGPILATRVADLDAKEVALHTRGEAFFSIAHFHGYPAVLIQLPRVGAQELEEAILDGWFACAPAAQAREFARTRR